MKTPDEYLPRMRPATGPPNPAMLCRKCGWRGLRLDAVRAAPNPSGTFVAGCPACKTFNLLPA